MRSKLNSLIIILFLGVIVPANLYAGKMRVGLAEKLDSSVPLPSFVEENLKIKIREKMIDSGKFDVIERSEKDLRRLFEEQKFSSERIGRVDISDEKKAEYGKIAGIEYLILITVNDFYEGTESSKFKKMNAHGRDVLRLGANLRIVHTSTGRIKVDKGVTAKAFRKKNGYSQGAHLDRSAANEAIESLSKKIVRNILDELYPIRILDRSGKIVFINRGVKHNIAINDSLEVFAIKKTMDVDTKEEVDLEYSVGKIKIVSISDRTSKAEIVEDFGINKGCIARLDENRAAIEFKKIGAEIEEKRDAKDW